MPVFARIEHAPISMMACPNQDKLNALVEDQLQNSQRMVGFCNERYFERLPGFIDVEVLTSMEISEEGEHRLAMLEEPAYMAVPIC